VHSVNEATRLYLPLTHAVVAVIAQHQVAVVTTGTIHVRESKTMTTSMMHRTVPCLPWVYYRTFNMLPYPTVIPILGHHAFIDMLCLRLASGADAIAVAAKSIGTLPRGGRTSLDTVASTHFARIVQSQLSRVELPGRLGRTETVPRRGHGLIGGTRAQGWVPTRRGFGHSFSSGGSRVGNFASAPLVRLGRCLCRSDPRPRLW
jgi:hypothetical protein